jgi:hypothetical protein
LYEGSIQDIFNEAWARTSGDVGYFTFNNGSLNRDTSTENDINWVIDFVTSGQGTAEIIMDSGGGGFWLHYNPSFVGGYVGSRNEHVGAIIQKRSLFFRLGAQGGGGVVQASFFPDLLDKGNALLNAGGTLVGAGELGIHYLRNYGSGSGPRELAKVISKFTAQRVGTQQVAGALRGYSNNARALGSKLGAVGAVLSTVDYVANFSDKNGYEHANYYLGLAAYGLAFVNPVGAGIAVVYGVGQLGSYFYNGKTLEENIGTSLGF